MKESRLFRILYYLLQNGRTTAPKLARELEVSVRTIYRDIDSISSAGIPIYVTTGRNGGIQLPESFVLDKSLFSHREKQDILAALQSAAIVNSCPEKETLAKLSALFHIPADNWFQVDFSRWGMDRQDNFKFELLKKAVISRHALQIGYVNAQGKRSRRKIYPLKLMFKAKQWYIKAYCVDSSGFRLLKCNRVFDAEVLPEEFPPMEYPDSEDTTGGSLCRIVLQFPKELAYRVYDEFAAEEISEGEKGDLIVSALLPEDPWLVGYLLSFGPQVSVISPGYFRKILSEEAKKILEKNKT